MLVVDRRSEPLVGWRVPYVVVCGLPGQPLIQLVRRFVILSLLAFFPAPFSFKRDDCWGMHVASLWLFTQCSACVLLPAIVWRKHHLKVSSWLLVTQCLYKSCAVYMFLIVLCVVSHNNDCSGNWSPCRKRAAISQRPDLLIAEKCVQNFKGNLCLLFLSARKQNVLLPFCFLPDQRMFWMIDLFGSMVFTTSLNRSCPHCIVSSHCLVLTSSPGETLWQLSDNLLFCLYLFFVLIWAMMQCAALPEYFGSVLDKKTLALQGIDYAQWVGLSFGFLSETFERRGAPLSDWTQGWKKVAFQCTKETWRTTANRMEHLDL